jgi:hypothetical protein
MGNFVPYPNTTGMGWIRMLDTQRQRDSLAVLDVFPAGLPFQYNLKLENAEHDLLRT